MTPVQSGKLTLELVAKSIASVVVVVVVTDDVDAVKQKGWSKTCPTC